MDWKNVFLQNFKINILELWHVQTFLFGKQHFSAVRLVNKNWVYYLGLPSSKCYYFVQISLKASWNSLWNFPWIISKGRYEFHFMDFIYTIKTFIFIVTLIRFVTLLLLAWEEDCDSLFRVSAAAAAKSLQSCLTLCDPID